MTIDENGTGYYLVQAASASVPNVAAVLAGTSIALTANVEGTATIGGLTGSTAYKVYFVAKDAAGNVQSGVSTVAFTTAAATAISDPTTGLELLKVSGGSYTMGDTFGDGNADEPAHQVTVSDFYIGKYAVTQGQWQDAGRNPRTSARAARTARLSR